jgi:hypothetical protein
MKIADFAKRQSRADSFVENFNPSGLKIGRLDRDFFLRVAIQVPAWGVTKVGKQRVSASLIFLALEDIFSLVVLLLNRIVTAHANGSKRIAVCCKPVSQHQVVRNIQNRQACSQPQSERTKFRFMCNRF